MSVHPTDPNVPTTSGNMYDYAGPALLWRSIPLRTIKKAFFKKGNTIRTLTKLILNSVTYDFKETAEGGAVIVPPEYAAVEFISPDGRIDYNKLLEDTLGNEISSTIEILKTNPIPAWDRFAEWFGKYEGDLAGLTGNITNATLETIDGAIVIPINIPVFANIIDMVSLLEVIYTATEPAHDQPMNNYKLDSAAFGWALSMVSTETNSDGTVSTSELRIGFVFRE